MIETYQNTYIYGDTIFLQLKDKEISILKKGGKWSVAQDFLSIGSSLSLTLTPEHEIEDVRRKVEKKVYDKLESFLEGKVEEISTQRQMFEKESAVKLAESGALDIAEEKVVNEINYLLGLHFTKDFPYLEKKLLQELNFWTYLQSDFAKLNEYNNFFSQVFDGLNPKAKKQTFEINFDLFLGQLKLTHLREMPDPSMPLISKAFFRVKADSITDIIKLLNSPGK